MSRAEETYDNPRAESLFPRYKAELLEGAAFANRLFFVQLQSHRFTGFPCVKTLSLSKLLREMALHIFSLRSRRQDKAWGGARQRATPGLWRNQSHQARECGRQFFVIRAFIMI